MNGLFVLSLGWALLHLVWQGTLIALALAVALAAVSRRAATVRYALACGALTLLVALPVFTTWSGYTSVRVSPAATAVAPTQPVLITPAPHEAITVAPAAPLPAWAGTALQSSAPALLQVRAALDAHMGWLILAWVLGVALSSARLGVSWLRLRRLAAEAVPAPEEWQERLRVLAARLRLSRPVRLLQSAALEVPAALGWLRPVVLLPVTTLTGLSARDVELVLAHELAHVRRHDFAVNLLQTLVESLLFFHPAVWWVSRVIRVEREHCCDDVAVDTGGNPLRYAWALTSLEALRGGPVGPQPALSALGGSLPERVRRLVSAPPTPCSSRWVAGASLLLLVSSLAVAAPLTVGLAALPTAVTAAAPEPRASSADRAEPREHERARDDDDAQVGRDVLSIDQLVQLKAAGITPERVNELRALGFEPTVSTLVQLGHAGVTAEEVKEINAHFGKRLAPHELLQLKTLGVTPDYVRELEAVGYKGLSPDELIQARSLGIDADFVRELSGAGLGTLSLNDLVQLRALGIDRRYIGSLEKEGLGHLDTSELVQLRALGIDAKLIRELRDAGLKKLTVEELVRLKATGVDADLIRRLRDPQRQQP